MRHLITSDIDGALYDTRATNWSSTKPVRSTYRHTYRDIQNLSQLKATLRAGSRTDLGGYPLVLYMGCDWTPVSFEGVRKDWKRVVSAMLDPYDTDWHIKACEVHWEGAPLICELTGQEIESAYGDPEEA